MIGNLLRRLFAGARATDDAPPAEPVEYKGYTITPAPVREGELWRVAGEISREVAGELRRHHLVRADQLPDRQAAVELTLTKARLTIDQLGDRLFG